MLNYRMIAVVSQLPVMMILAFAVIVPIRPMLHRGSGWTHPETHPDGMGYRLARTSGCSDPFWLDPFGDPSGPG